ncbi:MAG: hypothetical protein JXR94_23935 [Candidatus Hydrogenedentes bacterium]|nr:hypothetical protein [Candidatus Hydrogenedentota bacterium]
MDIHAFVETHLADDRFFMDLYRRYHDNAEYLEHVFREWCYNFPTHIDLQDTLDAAASFHRSARTVARLWFNDPSLVAFIDQSWDEYRDICGLHGPSHLLDDGS